MKEEPFVVKYLSVRNCYLYFSDYWVKRLSDLGAVTSALRVDYKNIKHAYFSWNPQPLNAGDDSVVRVSATYAQRLGIEDGEKITITFHNHVTSVSRVYMSPLTPDDFEILAMNQDLLQSGLLDQIQIVWPGQTLVAWVGTSMHAVLSVDAVEPKSQIGRLQMLTEIIVNTPMERHAQGDSVAMGITHDEIKSEEKSAVTEEDEVEEDSYGQKSSSVVSFIWDSVQGISSRLWRKEENEKDISARSEQSVTNILSEKLKLLEPLVFRVHPFQFPDESKVPSQFLHPFNAFIHKTNLLLPFLCTRKSLIAKIVPISFSSKSNLTGSDDEKKISENEKLSNSDNCMYVKLCIIDDILENTSESMKHKINTVFDDGGQRCIFLPSTVRAALHIKTGARVRVEIEGIPNQQPVSLVLTVNEKSRFPKDIDSIWRNYMLKLCGECDVLVNSNAFVPVLSSDNTIYHTLVNIIEPPCVPYFLFTKNILEKCKIKIYVNKGHCASVPVTEDEYFQKCEDYHCFSHLEKLISHGMTNIEITLGLTTVPWSLKESLMSVANVLVRGKSGSGVSTLARYLCNKFRDPPRYVHCEEIQCRNIKGKKVENLHRLFSQALGNCSLHQPAILLLQDLDVLAAAPSQDQEAAQESRYYTRVGEMLVELLQEYQPTFKIAILATATSSGKLNPTLMAPRGQHTFICVLNVPELNKDDRLKILEKLVENKVSLEQSEIDLHSFAQKSDGYVVQDLIDFMEKGVFEAWKRKAVAGDFAGGVPSLQNEDLEKAFQVMQPLALRGVELVQDAGLSWADIGGLDHAKKLLVEMLEWPVQFPDLFSQAPLRLQSGLLLYGAPGTGKTLLAGAVAKECGLNFISVKGPELLSKYIGASEEAVRTIFQKAQGAKPCVLFFDEFDSLAPRRGHDSTGVTDRVVNQLLTQLDGVESLNSVWVLAATSRPDLLDPALLRPGRLDRAVLCPLPTQEDRVAILQSLSRKMVLAEDVDLAAVAEKTEGFTGADLQAVLYSAQLAAVEEMSPLENSVLNKNAIPEDPPRLETLYVKDKNMKGPIHVTQSLLLAALKDTRPSLNLKEKEKYDRIYENFEKSRSNSSQKMMSLPLKQKVTLA